MAEWDTRDWTKGPSHWAIFPEWMVEWDIRDWTKEPSHWTISPEFYFYFETEPC